jgi:hypothetical protein
MLALIRATSGRLVGLISAFAGISITVKVKIELSDLLSQQPDASR